MNKLLIVTLTILFYTVILAQQNLSIITEIDYDNATRYTGARNIARSTEGYVVVVFEPGSGYTNQEIWYAIYNSAFGTWDVAQLSNSPSNDTGNPAVIANGQGEVYATWKENPGDNKRNAMFSKCSFIDPFTHSWSTPVIADTIDNNAGVLTIDQDINDNPFILFSIWNDPAIFNANIYASYSYDGGITWVTDNLTSVFPTPDYLPFNFVDVNLAPGKNGVMYAAWEDKPQPYTNQYEVLFSEFNPSTGWTLPVVLTPMNDGDPALHRYVDGCTPTGSAVSVYEMGPAGYQYAGLSSVIYLNNGTSECLSSFFNPYYTFPTDDKDQHIADIINFFGILPTDSILVVDDDNKYNNEWVITDALDLLNVQYRVFDCGDNGGMATQVPGPSDLNNKKLVIWFTGDDSNNLAYWNVNDEDNPNLISYLNITGSNLWSVGRDFIYDRYGTAPDDFVSGDFCYNYLGIDSYDVQSWADDGNTGVAQLDMVGGGVSTVNPIAWGNAGTRQGEPTIATDPAGIVHMAYLDDGGDHIFYKTYDGVSWSDSVQIDASDDTTVVQRPNISVDPNHGVYITWMQATEQIAGVNLYNVFYATSPDGGVTWNTAQQLSNTTFINSSGYSIKNPTIGKIVRPAITGVFEGGAEVVWTEANPSSSLGYYIMYARIPYVGTIIGVEDDEVTQPFSFSIEQNYPNPFNPATTIEFTVDKESHVSLDVFNVVGQKVDQIVSDKLTAGSYKYTWDAAGLPSGVYFAKLQSDGRQLTKKLTLLK